MEVAVKRIAFDKVKRYFSPAIVPPSPDPFPHREGRGALGGLEAPPSLWGRGLGWGFILILLLTGCGILDQRPTVTPIFVTATPVAQEPSQAPTPNTTAVLAPTPESTATSSLPTLEPATKTPPPTQAPSLTPSFTITYTDSPAPSQPTGMPVKCTAAPQGGFGMIYGKDPALQRSLGCAVGAAVAINSASLSFENGQMLWASQFGDAPTKMIYVLYKNGTYQRYPDTWFEKSDPESTGEIAPAGKLTPVRGFGKVWHNNPAVKSGLGWATNQEVGTPGQIQRFERGEMLFVATLGQTFIFISGTTSIWRADSTPF